MKLSTPLSSISLIKKASLTRLERLGLFTVGDLLSHIPSRYEDYSRIRPIAELTDGELCSLIGTVSKIHSGRTFHKKLFLTEATLTDVSGSIRLVWFNQRFVAQTLREGIAIRVSGKVTSDKTGLVIQSPDFERSDREATHTGRLVPVYPETQGLTSKYLRWQIALAFKKLESFPDPVPESLLKKLSLPDLKHTFYYLHFPKTEKHVALAKKRLAFQEMFLVQLKVLQVKAEFERNSAIPLKPKKEILARFLDGLPFELTKGQKHALKEISLDLAKDTPMNRLLNGDVGSGKTVVAGAAALITTSHSHQVAFLAPTEVLARQHFETLTRLFSHTQTAIALFTGSFRLLDGQPVSRQTMIKAIGAGMPDIVVGTHALLQEDVSFKNLALIIVDEQHRFGVAQRAALQDQSVSSRDGDELHVPHFLTMTATPIPRTLSLAFFGNLSVSLLEDMPKERKPIITLLAHDEAEEQKAYHHIREELESGRQAFIIFPLVEASLALKDVKAAVTEHERLAKHMFPDQKVGIIHGRLKPDEKEKVMRDFKDQKYAILVATAVIEVGIDIPNASIIMIQEADRFGLSQLHQFRGRVGRGAHQSYCYLIPGNFDTPPRRLEVLASTNNGFEIAEADLAERGPGSFFGTRQSGLPDVAMENMTNLKLVTIARQEAEELLKKDPELKKHSRLQEALKHLDERIHFE